ncbi:MAG: DUF6067 family protein [Prevotella sp.]|nr:DUF6067 family protein [Prevotella sp.]
MKRTLSVFLTAMISLSGLWAQSEEGVTQCGTPTGQPAFPSSTYQELPDPKEADPEAWETVKGTFAMWGNTDTRYAKHIPPVMGAEKGKGRTRKSSLYYIAFHGKNGTPATIEGWRGEKLHAQAVVWTEKKVERLNYRFTVFQNAKGDILPASALNGGFVRYVMTDQLNHDGKGGCGARPDHAAYDSSLVADCIDHTLKEIELPPKSVQPLWVNCQIPADAVPGLYTGSVVVSNGDVEIASLPLNIRVSNRILPPPSAWTFHLDLWQNPFAVARYYQVPLWSQKHFDAMRPIMKMLADAGQKVITVSLMHKPWDGQTEDYFESMVTWIKKVDGTWQFDFSVFDKWVQFMHETGINRQINCYSMVPWKLSFQYFDQATNRMQTLQTNLDKEDYKEVWTALLSAFARHLKEKGWFDTCTIAMDERPMDMMRTTLDLIHKAVPDFKVSLAGNYHEQIEAELHDYCITIGQKFPETVKARRKKEGKISTFYTCCTEAFPNTFTFSQPAEAAWIGWKSAKERLDGYLRWAYNSWPKEPLQDSRFRSWAGGDTYLVYPGARSSIRFEKLLEGIQAHEKINILRRQFTQEGNQGGLRRIENMLCPFRLDDFPAKPAAKTVQKANKLLNKL